MAVTIYYEKDCDPSVIQGKKVAIIGYGSQGHAHALNLMDSGCDVRVGLRPGSKSAQKAQEAGLKVCDMMTAAKEANVIMMLVPDETQPAVYEEFVAPNLEAGDTLAFAHGFNIHYGYIKAPEDVNVIMCAPKGPGHIVRRQYTEGSGVPDLACVAQDATGDAWGIALSYCWGIGGARSGVIKSTFKDETEEDLFGEQAVLCGGLVELVKAGFETLTEAGYPEELAYFEVYHEMKMIVDLMYESGIHFMNYSISNTAEYGEYYAGPKVINDQSRAAMKEILGRIQDGSFAAEFVADCNNDHKWLLEKREEINTHPIEKTGEKIRSMFSWIKKD
ncbi:ketol-acid reductoisomerase [Thermophilibacter immobilis]|jgi:ketol-acid reductoisomerase|uniref:Ketol-acid reductoisomerase (NADP(+)) n=1 Tax=Thermophilibacter immobilis TaxID=2779519 RepID=A0A7S7RU31_9ACTN|nr:ketol-acid reductoisomerase [Thermophilibacter immobilis]QOY60002.1 ketol-acid reductoisomerase [Thermophilibacter immobilis]